MTLTKIFDFRILDHKIGISISPHLRKEKQSIFNLYPVACVHIKWKANQAIMQSRTAGWEKEMWSFSFHYDFTSSTTLSG